MKIHEYIKNSNQGDILQIIFQNHLDMEVIEAEDVTENKIVVLAGHSETKEENYIKLQRGIDKWLAFYPEAIKVALLKDKFLETFDCMKDSIMEYNTMLRYGLINSDGKPIDIDIFRR